MDESLNKDSTFECPYCHEKCIGLWKKIRVFRINGECRCPNCEAVLRYDAVVYGIKIIVSIFALFVGLYYIKIFPTGRAMISSNIPLLIIGIFEVMFVRFTKLRYRPDGKHPERIYKKEAQTLYGTMLFYVEDNVLYEQDYVVRVINQEQEVEFRISKGGYKTENVIDLVYNDDRQSIFRIFDHYVTLRTGEMMVSSDFSVN